MIQLVLKLKLLRCNYDNHHYMLFLDLTHAADRPFKVGCSISLLG